MASNVSKAPPLAAEGLEGFQTVAYWDFKDGIEARLWRKDDIFQTSSFIRGSLTRSPLFHAPRQLSPEEYIKETDGYAPRIKENGSVIFLTNKISKSVLDPTKTIDRMNWAVTLIDRASLVLPRANNSVGSTSGFSTWFGHAVIVIETIEFDENPDLDGLHKIWKADLQLSENGKIKINYAQVSEDWVNEKGIPFKTETWLRTSTLVQKMINRIKLEVERIKKELPIWSLERQQFERLQNNLKDEFYCDEIDGNFDEYSMFKEAISPANKDWTLIRPVFYEKVCASNYSISSNSISNIFFYNCLVWAKERIFLADIYMPLKPFMNHQVPSIEIGSYEQEATKNRPIRRIGKIAQWALMTAPVWFFPIGLTVLTSTGVGGLLFNMAAFGLLNYGETSVKREQDRYKLFKLLVEEGEI